MSMADETSGDYADDLAAEIEAGEVDPEDVDLAPIIEDEARAMTPALWQQLPETKREDYNERVGARDEADLQEQQQELGREQRAALDALESAVTEDADDRQTATITFGSAELVVSTRIPGRVEQALDRIREESQKPVHEQSLDRVVGDLLDGITSLIVDDDEPDDDPHDFTDREVWEQFYLDHGSEALLDAFETIAEPARERRERLESFRDERRGGGGARRE